MNKQLFKIRNDRSGFTLIELLVVIAILAVLAVVVVLTLNPAGMLQEARDSNRISDMATVNSALGLSLADNSSESLGSAKTVYVSVPDTSPTCANLGLPVLPSGYTYHCSTAASSTYRKTDSTGWIPVNLSANTFGSSMAQLPLDPVNTTSSRFYYTYETDGNGRYEATTPFESAKYRLGGTSDQISGDGGTLASIYEKGSKLGMEPLDYGDPSLVGSWTFDEGTGSVAYDYSGNNATGSWQGTASGTSGYYSAGKVGSWAGAFDGTSTYVGTSFNSSVLGSSFSLCAWVELFPGGGNYPESFGTTGNNILFGAVGGGGSKMDIYIKNSVGSYTDTSNSNSMSLSAWHFVTGTFDGTNGRVYVDGVLQATTPAGTAASFSGLMNIGKNLASNSYWNGLIDDVRIYNRALSAAEIQALYSGGK